jgi:hypothetical protein
MIRYGDQITIKKGMIMYLLCALMLSLGSSIYGVYQPVISFIDKNVHDARRHTFKRVLGLMEERKVKTIVETGTARGGHMAFSGDGGFTIIFGYWASLNNAQLYSVDINEQALKNARTMITDYLNNVDLVLDDSVHYLENFPKTIDLLYLDSFDFEKNNPRPSQEHHLKEIQAAYDKLNNNSIVMIDDCDLPHGGKGKLVIEYLVARGWKIVAKSYQVILVKG